MLVEEVYFAVIPLLGNQRLVHENNVQLLFSLCLQQTSPRCTAISASGSDRLREQRCRVSHLFLSTLYTCLCAWTLSHGFMDVELRSFEYSDLL
jgi:hypothetical protein